MEISPSIIFIGIGISVFLIVMVFLTSRYKKVRGEGDALIVNGLHRTRASLTGTFVWPIVNRFEYMDITRKKISVVRSGRKDQEGEEYEGLHCRDNIRADLKVDFYIGVNHEEEDIVRVAKLFTAHEASNLDRLKEHFQPKFSEALKTAVKQFEFEELLTNRRAFRDAVVEVIGSEMDGFKIYDVVIDKVDQTALDAHSPDNILDVEGIRKISAITAQKNTETNAIRQDERTTMKKKNVEAEANRLQLDKQEKESIARIQREVDIIKAQEEALAAEKQQEYLRVTELAKLETEEEVSKKRESVEMEVEMTRIANQRQVAIQQEELTRSVETEKVRTATEVVEREMHKETTVEEALKAVSETRSQRVEIERKIAREEEETENLRVNERVGREKRVKMIEAEAAAEAAQLELLVGARAEKDAAKERAERLLIENEAELKVKTRDAENDLAVKTREAEAEHIVTTKRAEAGYVAKEREAAAKERMAHAEKEMISATGLAEVEVDRERAQAIKETGEAEAFAMQSAGEAEAQALRAKGLAEAESQTARFEAAQQYDEHTRDHDKWVMQLQQDKDLEIARIDAQKTVVSENAKALAEALSKADIRLFGGEGMEQIRRTIMDASAIDAKFEQSKVLNPLVSEYVDGNRSLPEDLKAILENTELKSSDLSNVALASLLNSQGGATELLKKIQSSMQSSSDDK
ncbi:peptidase [Enterovibrio norvegicus]|uniref:Peptidase n=1 Tax=Enterovibrio norvegicus TaxID=188144 RepID=A0A2N7L6N7_9GAMM|nr:peptidase [Enterovibrio norvegicus]PML76599.1 peptidase [Enterovibrio norvegicus]PMN65186.1 peptidase [Enterovibrio norvegicus]PMN89603.1 peptidase [Enterovibrio norvegicus]